jgi:succinyl-CoA synthetase beta subunit
MDQKIATILEASRRVGWVMEPYAKELLRGYGLPTTRFYWAKTVSAIDQGIKEVGYPLVAKVVSPDILHKSEVGGVVIGITGLEQLTEVFRRFSTMNGFDGVLLDEMIQGTEVIVGAKDDPQFGTVVLVGIGGTSVEVYKDVAIRMAPVEPREALDAIESLKGKILLEGYRGREAIHLQALGDLIVRFSNMAYDLRDLMESIDLNPVICGREKAVIADARIVLK